MPSLQARKNEFDGSVNGHAAKIVLDSGADIGSVSDAFAEQAGIGKNRRQPINMLRVIGEKWVYGSTRLELTFLSQALPIAGLAVVPASFFDILLGRGVFEQMVVQIDYPN